MSLDPSATSSYNINTCKPIDTSSMYFGAGMFRKVLHSQDLNMTLIGNMAPRCMFAPLTSYLFENELARTAKMASVGLNSEPSTLSAFVAFTKSIKGPLAKKPD